MKYFPYVSRTFALSIIIIIFYCSNLFNMFLLLDPIEKPAEAHPYIQYLCIGAIKEILCVKKGKL